MTAPLTPDVEREEHLWLSAVRRDPGGEVRFYPSNKAHGMSGTWAGQVTDSVDAMIAAAVAAERERLLGKIAKIAATPGAKAWRDLRALLAAERAGGEDRG